MVERRRRRALAHGLGPAQPPRGTVRRKREHRPAEEDEPDRQQRHRRPHVFGMLVAESEGRRIGLDQADEDQNQTGQSAEIADRPSPAGYAADPIVRCEIREHRVVEHRAQLEAEIDQDDHAQGIEDPGRIGRGKPKKGRGDRHQRGKPEDPGLAASSGIGDGAEDGGGDGDQQRARRQAPAPQSGALYLIADDTAGKVGREDEGDDHRRHRRIRPVEQAPGHEAKAAGRSPDGPARWLGPSAGYAVRGIRFHQPRAGRRLHPTRPLRPLASRFVRRASDGHRSTSRLPGLMAASRGTRAYLERKSFADRLIWMARWISQDYILVAYDLPFGILILMSHAAGSESSLTDLPHFRRS